MAKEYKDKPSKSFSDKLNLQHTDSPIRTNPTVEDPELLICWNCEAFYLSASDLNSRKPKYILHDEPSYTNEAAIKWAQLLVPVLVVLGKNELVKIIREKCHLQDQQFLHNIFNLVMNRNQNLEGPSSKTNQDTFSIKGATTRVQNFLHFTSKCITLFLIERRFC